MQTVWAGHGDTAERVDLPDPHIPAFDAIPWGSADVYGTPAYWAVRCRWSAGPADNFFSGASSLAEEVGFCLLGGYSVTYESNLAAFAWLKQHRIFDLTVPTSAESIEALLNTPILVEGKLRRYRFPKQRGARLMGMRDSLVATPPRMTSELALRNDLMTITGIGPKTASWIVRNHCDSDAVAILDIHVIRAGQALGLFPATVRLPGDYLRLERRFLDFATALSVRASVLDAVMWSETRKAKAA